MRTDVGQVAAASKFCLDISLVAGGIYAVLHKGLHLRVSLEVAVYQSLCLCTRHLHSLCQTEGRDAVDDAKVGRLGFAALIAVHLFDGLSVDARGGGGMDVLAGAEVFNHILIATEVRHDAQLHLRIVGREEEAALLGHEGLANLAAVLSPHGDVLQVGVARRKATGGRHGLIEGGVQMAGGGIYQFGQCLDVGAEEFFQTSVCQYLPYNRVLAAQALEHLFRGGVLTALGLLGLGVELQFLEEHLAHLAR